MDSKLASPKINLFTENQIEQIHEATLKILETVGVKMQHPRGAPGKREHGNSLQLADIG